MLKPLDKLLSGQTISYLREPHCVNYHLVCVNFSSGLVNQQQQLVQSNKNLINFSLQLYKNSPDRHDSQNSIGKTENPQKWVLALWCQIVHRCRWQCMGSYLHTPSLLVARTISYKLQSSCRSLLLDSVGRGGDILVSVVPCNKVVSPSKEDLTPGCMCKVKKFEKCLAQVKAIGKDV